MKDLAKEMVFVIVFGFIFGSLNSIDDSLKIIAEYYKYENPADTVRAIERGEE